MVSGGCGLSAAVCTLQTEAKGAEAARPSKEDMKELFRDKLTTKQRLKAAQLREEKARHLKKKRREKESKEREIQNQREPFKPGPVVKKGFSEKTVIPPKAIPGQ